MSCGSSKVYFYRELWFIDFQSIIDSYCCHHTMFSGC